MEPSAKVVGHRGASGLLPENTLAAFSRAIDLGVDAVECDVRLTADGRLIVMHDETVDRTTDGAGAVAEMDLAATRKLDAGGGQPPPTFDELLDVVAGRCELYCELKGEGTPAPAVEAVTARGMAADTMFVSFSFDRLAEARRLLPGARIGPIVSRPTDERLDRLLAMRPEMASVDFKNVSLALAEKVHDAGAALGVWTPNHPPQMRAMLALGADIITTDRPDLLLELLARPPHTERQDPP